MTVNLYMVEEKGRYGVQCSACQDRFFDRLSKGKHPRVLESGVIKAIEHAKTVHHSEGGHVTTMPVAEK